MLRQKRLHLRQFQRSELAALYREDIGHAAPFGRWARSSSVQNETIFEKRKVLQEPPSLATIHSRVKNLNSRRAESRNRRNRRDAKDAEKEFLASREQIGPLQYTAPMKKVTRFVSPLVLKWWSCNRECVRPRLAPSSHHEERITKNLETILRIDWNVSIRAWIARPERFIRLAPAVAVVAFTSALLAADSQDNTPLPAKVQFNRDIQPIFSDICFKCHGPDAKARKAKLRLDVREDALRERDGKFPIVPGNSAKSEAYRRLMTTDPDDLMPPPASNKKLTKRQIELIRRWIDQGAEYQPHWAYIPPKRAELPKVKDKSWVRNPIDSFILSELEARNIQPSTEAEKRTLLRRLSLDLIGLPPTSQEIEAFLKDKSKNAYGRQVERLLASPHYGERMAVPWLDLARFADTVGYHGDQNQRIFPYRDYVINSFNRNKPFNQFTVEQLAGDLLPNPNTEQRVATGFNRLNMVTREGGAQPKEYLAKYQADRVRTVATTWLGSTMACCECHDHKYDPFSTKDFYSLSAFFADVKQWGVYADYNYTPNPELKSFGNDHPWPPEIEIESPYLKRRAERMRRLIREHFGVVFTQAGDSAEFTDWLKASREFVAKTPDGWQALEVIPPVLPVTNVVFTTNITATATNIVAKTNSTGPLTVTMKDEGAVAITFTKTNDAARIELRLHPGRIAALRLQRGAGAHEEDLSEKDGIEARGIHLSARLKHAGEETNLNFYRADADFKDPRYDNGEEIVGVLPGWLPANRHADETQNAVWLAEPPLKFEDGDTLIVTLKSRAPLTGRFFASPFAAEDPLQAGSTEEFRAALNNFTGGSNQRKDAQAELLAERYLLSTQSDKDAFNRFKELQADFLNCRNGHAYTLVTAAQKPFTTRVLPRGNWQDENGEIVQPAPPHFLPQPSKPNNRQLTRLDLAKWLVSEDNPLTARTFMNRLWKQFFGAGLSTTIDDLGMQGDLPSHPELLDWLSVEFMQPQYGTANAQPAQAWDVKHMIKLIVMSATYRQDSNQRPELKEIDPSNRLLACQNPRRLEAEFVRDSALFISGLLNTDMGGPSAHPYQPPGYYANIQYPDRDYYPEKDERQYRRGVYTHWQRTFVHPMLANFDGPSREECTAFRIVSNTPQQALTLLNDPSFTEAARVFAQRILANKKSSDDEKLDLVYQTALCRAPKAKEKKSLKEFLAGQREYCRANSEDAGKLIEVGFTKPAGAIDHAELAAWTEVCRVVLNLHETITRY